MIGKKFYIISFITIILALTLTYKHEEVQASTDKLMLYLKKINLIMQIVDTFYVEEPDREKMLEGAINGMLEELDPHSTYIPPKEQEKVDEEFNEEFGGIGIRFEIKNKYLTVISPIPGTPSSKLGLQPGDRITKIDGTTAYGIETEEVFKRLKGPIGSKVVITIYRDGEDKEADYEIIRAAIPVHSVIAKCMLEDKRTGYIQLNLFAKKTAEETEEALVDLEEQGMDQLILDLRGNSGGLMDQAIDIVDLFLTGDKKIVYTQGRDSTLKEEYYSTDFTTRKQYPIIVLIDAGSASASEIVSGALQDQDRAFILGVKSFGKGLVQRPFDLGDGSVARITIAKYYTPTGRLIQRPYDNGKEAYYYDRYFDNEKNREDLDSLALFKLDSVKNSQKYYTLRKKRVVYGGGGITPDSTVYYDTKNNVMNTFYRKRVFQDYTIKFFNKFRDKEFSWKNNFEEFYENFNVTNEMIDELLLISEENGIVIEKEVKVSENDNDSVIKSEVLDSKKELKKMNKKDKNKIYLTEKDFISEKDNIIRAVRLNIARQYFDDRSMYPRINAMGDKHIKIALTLFDEARDLMSGRKND